MSHRTHHTPLRRVSVGSLAGLARSGGYPHGPTGLEFLEPPLADLADDAEQLHANMEGLNRLTSALDTFNDSFASYLYAMRMNAYCVEWEEAPTEVSFERASVARKAQEDMAAALLAMQPSEVTIVAAAEQKTMLDDNPADTTFANPTGPTGTAKAAAKGKGKGKPKLTAKERKERNNEMDRIIATLPLEFRGQEPTLRSNAESVIEALMNAADEGLKITDMVKSPQLPQARVNKCLLALINRKIVQKSTLGGLVMYKIVGLPGPR